MGYNSQSGQVGFKTQPSQGTFADPGAVSPDNGVFMRTESGALEVKRSVIIPNAEIGGNRDVPAGYLGPASFGGSYNFYARMESLATLMTAAMGATSDTTAGATTALVGTHVITPVDSVSLPWLSIEEAVSTFDVFNYTDAKVNQLKLSVVPGGILSGVADIVAMGMLDGATKTAVPYWDVTPLIIGTKVQVLWNGVAMPANSFEITINNNLDETDFRLGSLLLGDLPEKRRQINGQIKIRPADKTFWRTAVLGSSGATTVQGGTAATGSLHVIANTYEVIGTSVVPYLLDIVIPSAQLQPFALQPSGDNILEHTIPFEATRPDPTVALTTVTIKNHLATVL